jgi:hypothetical protein
MMSYTLFQLMSTADQEQILGAVRSALEARNGDASLRDEIALRIAHCGTFAVVDGVVRVMDAYGIRQGNSGEGAFDVGKRVDECLYAFALGDRIRQQRDRLQ